MLLERIERELCKLKPAINDNAIYDFVIICKQQFVNYPDMIEDIEEAISSTFDSYVNINEDEDGYEYFNGATIKIRVSDTCCYKIIFSYVSDYEGYCQCKEGMEGYDSRYDCCGYKCDWDRPYVEIEKIETLGENPYDGTQHSLWDAIDKYMKDSELRKEQERKAKINKLKEEKERIEKELIRVNKELENLK